MAPESATERLFSYGTLQYEGVQLATFGRKLVGKTEAVVGYRLDKVQIMDPGVIEKSGEAIHRMMVFNGDRQDIVEGMVFEITPIELQQADQYEVAAYKRSCVQLASGEQAWAYVSAQDSMPPVGNMATELGAEPTLKSDIHSMRPQQAVWMQEHATAQALPTLAEVTPSDGVVRLVEFLQDHHVPMTGRAVDIGCGKGRNAVYLASLGFDVDAVDYIPQALDTLRQLAQVRGVIERIKPTLAAIDEPWDFPDLTFDLAIDSFSSIDIETLHGREVCRNEMFRTLKPGGYALVTVVSADDEWERELIAKSPGPERNSTIWPQTGKFQKDYSELELRQFYQQFDILVLSRISKAAFKLGRAFQATNYWLVLRKPLSN